MRGLRIAVLGVVALVMAACTTGERAEMAARNIMPTGYEKRTAVFGTNGYGDEAVNETTQEIWFVGNSVTSPRRAVEIVRYRAAMIGRERGASHFSMDKTEIKVTCSRQGNVVRATGNAVYGDAGSLPGKAQDVEEVIGKFQARLGALDDASYESRQRTYLANRQSCYTKRLVDPKSITLESERDAN